MAPPRRVALPGGPLRSRLLTLGRGATPLAARQPDCWSVPAFGAKWIISGRQKVRCGRPACITNAYSWHNLQLVHRLGDYHGTPIITVRRRMRTRILQHALHGNRRPVKRCEQPDRPVATRARGRGRTGRSEGFCRRLDPRVGPLHRKTACPGGTQGGPNCLTHSPPWCFPTPNLREADGGG